MGTQNSEQANKRASERGARMPVRTFRDLLVWQKGIALAKAIYTSTMKMPADERFGLTLQMRRAAVSIPSNIAEGHARQSRADYLRFLRTARGSLAELETQIELSASLNMLDADALLPLCKELAVMLQSLIRKLEAKGTD